MKLLLPFLLLFALSTYAQPVDRGDLQFVFSPSNYPVSIELKQNPELAIYRDYLNNTLALPFDVPVNFCDCGIENAFYNPATRSIKICYEFIQAGLKRTKARFGGADHTIISGIATTVVGHELGHGLRHWYNLPITGKEESAVDQFSAVMIIKGPSVLYSGGLYGAFNWFAMSRSFSDRLNRALDPAKGYGDVHAPSAERYYDILAVLSGSDAGMFQRNGFVGNQPWQLSANRAKNANREYNQAIHTWDTLLKDYYKKAQVEPTKQPTISAALEPEEFRRKKVNIRTVAQITPSQWDIRGFYIPLSSIEQRTTITYAVTVDENGYPVRIKRIGSTLSESNEKTFTQAIQKSVFDFELSAAAPNPPTGTSKLNVTFVVDPN